MRLTSGPAALGVGLLVLAAVIGFGTDASASTVRPGALQAAAVVLTGSAPASAHGPGTVAFSYTIEVPVELGSTVFTTTQPDELPALSTGVLLDGQPVPAARISRPDLNDIAVQTGATAAGGLAAGTHTLSFSASIASLAAASTKSSATLSWLDAGGPGSIAAADVPVALNQPDLSVALTPNSGEDQVSLLGTGRDLAFSVDVANLGYGTPRSTLSIALPPGLKLGADGVSRQGDGRSLSCRPAGPRLVECDLGVLTHAGPNLDPTLNLDLTGTAAAPTEGTVPVTVSVRAEAGEGIDTNPGNDAVTGRIRFTGSARLSYTLTPARRTVVLGGRSTVRLSIHNAGPQAAPQAVAFTIVIGGNFQVVGFTGKLAGASLPVPGPLSDPQPGPGISSASGTELLWQVGDIPAGGTVTATLTVKALRLGTAKIGLTAFSGAADPNCPDLACDPSSVSIRAVAAPARIVPARVITRHPAATAPILPVTGSTSGPVLKLGLGLLLAGCGLVLLGRRQVGC